MRPYYEESGITIYHGDCREVLPQLQRNSLQLILTDPPYGQKFISSRHRASPKFSPIVGDDGSLDVLECLRLALKLLHRNRHIYVFGSIDLRPLPLGGIIELIWDKGTIGLGNLDLPWGLSHEKIAFGVNEYSVVNRAAGAGNGAARLRRSSILRFQRLISGQVKNHPTEKPLLLLRELIESSSFIGETVLDLFMGSGSTLEAAKREGRQAIGIEIEEHYCEIAANRLRQNVLPLVVGE